MDVMNQSETVSDILRCGWLKFQSDSYNGWKFFFRRNLKTSYVGDRFEYDYLTVFKNGRTAEGIIETGYQRKKRKRQEILYRDFRGYPLGK